MVTQICPTCNKDAFTWYMNDGDDECTIWYCQSCSYKAIEDEKDQRFCKSCLKQTESKLKDSEMEYWWCCACNSKISIITL